MNSKAALSEIDEEEISLTKLMNIEEGLTSTLNGHSEVDTTNEVRYEPNLEGVNGIVVEDMHSGLKYLEEDFKK